MSFPGEDAEVIYIFVSINIYIGNDMDSGHYVCYVLDYNTGTWRNCDYDTITKYSEYPKNVYDIFQRKLNQKRENFNYEWIRYDCVNMIH